MHTFPKFLSNKKLLFAFFLTFYQLVAFAQTGPGGVGKKDGTSSLRLWLKADASNITTGSPVTFISSGGTTTWKDESGYGNDFSNPNDGNRTYQYGVMTSGLPAIRFTGGSTADLINANLGSSLTANWTIYTVVRGGTLTGTQTLLSWGDNSNRKERNMLVSLSGTGGSYVSISPNTTSAGGSITTTGGNTKLGGGAVFGVSNASNNTYVLDVNGTSTSITTGTTKQAYTSTQITLGSENNGTSNPYLNDVAEVVAYNAVLNSAETVILENALGAKYNITLGANDYFTESGNYFLSVIGVGYFSGSQQLTAEDGDIKIAADATTLSGTEFFFAGHAGVAHGKTSTGIATSPSIQGFDRWNRIYRYHKTGSLTTTITFDLAKAALAGNQYVLMYSPDPLVNFVSVTTANISSKSLSGGKISFTVLDAGLPAGTGYFTLGNTSTTIQPITLYSVTDGNWETPSNWTLNSNGTANNPDNLIPDLVSNINAVVRAGNTVSLTANTATTNNLEIYGTLDLLATTGHTYSFITGTGTMKIASGTFPTHTSMLDFTSINKGTVEYYGSGSYTITPPTASTYNNIVFTGGTKTLGGNIILNGNLTINSASTLDDGNKNITLKGNWTNSGTYTSGASSAVIFNNTTIKQSIFGVNAFPSVTVSKASAKNIEFNANQSIKGVLTLNSGNIILGDHNLTLEDAATVTGTFSTASMIEQKGTNVAGKSKLIVKRTSAMALTTYPIGTPNYYSPMQINSFTGTVSNAVINIEAVPYTSFATAVVLRKWAITATGVTPTSVIMTFTYPPSEKVGSPTKVVHTDPATGVAQGFTATLTSNTFAPSSGLPLFAGEWTQGEAPSILYSRNTGNWNDGSNWSLTNGGAAAGQIPDANTYAFVKAGHTVTMNINNAQAAQLTVDGTLNSALTTGHSFTVLTGGGTLRFATGTFPTFSDMSGFSNNPTSTVVYEGNTNYQLSNLSVAPDTYNHITFSGSGTRRLPNDLLYVRGNLLIDNTSVTVDNNNQNIILYGNWTNNTAAANGFITSGNLGQVVFANTSADQTVGGTATTSFGVVEVAKSSGFNVLLTQNMRANGTIKLTSGNIVLGTRNLTMGPQAGFTHAFGSNFSTAAMVEYNGSAPSAYPATNLGKLIIERTSISGYTSTIYPVGTSTSLCTPSSKVYTPFIINNLSGTLTGTGTVAVIPSQTGFGADYVQRQWRVETNGISNVQNARFDIYFDPCEIAGNPSQATFKSLALVTAFVTGAYYDDGVRSFGVSLDGNTAFAGDWILGPEIAGARTYYAGRTGVTNLWQSSAAWTTEPDGISAAKAVDDYTVRPGPTGPRAQDKLIILPNVKVEMNGNNTAISATEIQAGATLEFYTTTGHTLGVVTGTGTIACYGWLPTQYVHSTSNWGSPVAPAGRANYLAFMSSTGGTVEFKGNTSYNLPLIGISSAIKYNAITLSSGAGSTYNNIKLSMTGTANVVTAVNDLNMNGQLDVNTGTFRINNNTSTTRLQIVTSKDVTVGVAGRITVGTANTHTASADDEVRDASVPYGSYRRMYHSFYMMGNFTNNGIVKLTNEAVPRYQQNTLLGAADLFMVGDASSADVSMDLNNTTDITSLTIDKGNNRTRIVTLNPSAYANFRLFGRNDMGGGGFINGNSGDPALCKALWIRNGTFEVKGYTNIPTLTEPRDGQCGGSPNTDYYVPGSAALWLNGDFVTVRNSADNVADLNVGGITGVRVATSTVWDPSAACTSFSMYGLLRLTKGNFFSGRTGGLIFWPNADGAILIEGGTLTATQLRTNDSPPSGKCTYTQTGGELILSPNNHAWVKADAGIFCIRRADNVFNMSGGKITILGVIDWGNAGEGVRAANAIEINSAPGNYNVTGGEVEIRLSNMTGTRHSDGWVDYEIGTRAPLYNLTITKSADISRQRKVIIRYYPLVVLNKLTITSQGTSDIPATLDANRANNTDGSSNLFDLTVGGDFEMNGGKYIPAAGKRTIFSGFSTATAVSGRQTVTNNVLAGFSETAGDPYGTRAVFEHLEVKNIQDGTVFLTGNTAQSFLVNRDLYLTQGTINDGGEVLEVRRNIVNNTEHFSTGAGKLLLSGSNAQTIGGNGLGFFGNIELNKSGGSTTFIADQKAKGTINFVTGILDIDRYNLYMSANATFTGTFSNTRMVRTKGKQSNGGITKQFGTVGSFTYPFGARYGTSSADVYTPYFVTVTSATTLGSITARPNNAKHPLLTGTGSNFYGLDYYWRLEQNGFTGVNVSHTFQSPAAPTIFASVSAPGTVANSYTAGSLDYAAVGTALAWITGNTSNFSVSGSTYTVSLPTVNYIERDFTAGQFQNVPVATDVAFRPFGSFYSLKSGNWTDPTVWSLNGHTGSAGVGTPNLGNVVFISSGHTVMTTGNSAAGSLLIRQGGVLDGFNYNGHNFGIIFIDSNTPMGTFRRTDSGGTCTFPGGDFGNFLGDDNGGTMEYYSTTATNYTIPTSPTGTYYNLFVSTSGTGVLTMPNQDQIVYQDMKINGTANTLLSSATSGNMDIRGKLWIAKGKLRFQNATARTVTVTGDLQIDNGASFDVNNGGAVVANKVILNKNLIVNGDVFMTVANNATSNYADLTFTSSNDTFITGTGNVFLNRLIVDKDTDPTFTLEASTPVFRLNGSLGSLSSALKPLVLLNGTFKLNTTDTNPMIINSGTYNMNDPSNPTAADLDQNFSISTSSQFWLAKGFVRGNADKHQGGLFLSGKLKVSGGEFRLESATSTRDSDNYIEIKNTSTAEIEVTGGSLIVGSQVRRNPVAIVGPLRYTQSGGTVNVGTQNGIMGNRGMFEVLGDGSFFKMSGGTLTIVRPRTTSSDNPSGTSGGYAGQQRISTVTDLYIDPSLTFSSVSGGTIQIGSGSAPSYTATDYSNVIEVNVVKEQPIFNFAVHNSGASTTTRLIENVLKVINDITITGNNSIFDANNLSVYNGRNFTNNNSSANPSVGYINSDTTYMDGVYENQIIGGTGVTSFNKLVLDNIVSNGTIGLGRNALVNTYFRMNTGKFMDNAFTLTLKGDMHNGSVHETTGAGSITIDHASNDQKIDGSGYGQFGTLIINKAAGTVLMNADHQINTRLVLGASGTNTGVLYTQDNVLTLAETATVTTGVAAGFGITRMIKSNGSASFGGVRKLVPTGVFNYFVPIGVKETPMDKYTPYQMENLSSSSNDGSVLVRAVNSKHPATNVNTNTTELAFYWRVTSDNLIPSSLLMKQGYRYDPIDVKGSASQYVAARLGAVGASYKWLRDVVELGSINTGSGTPFISINGGTNVANQGTNYVDGDYTAGYITEFQALDTFRSVKNGSWLDGTVWDKTTIPTRGSVVFVSAGHSVSMGDFQRSVYALNIDAGSTLDVGMTQLHDFGIIKGNGTLKVGYYSMPTGVYDDFVKAGTGGTIEFASSTLSGGYTIPSIKTFNNLVISSPDTITMANVDIVLNGSLTINSGSELINNFGKSITIHGNFINNGFFNAGSRNTLITFTGTNAQTIGGSSATNFRILSIDKDANNVSVIHDIMVADYLSLKQGIIQVQGGKSLTLTSNLKNSSDPGNENSFVSGTMCKLGTSDFVFPVGSTYWARLAISSLVNANYDGTTLANSTKFCAYHLPLPAPNSTSTSFMKAPVKIVSQYEYWDISRTFDVANDAQTKVAIYFEDLDRSHVKCLNPADPSCTTASLRLGHFRTSGADANKWCREGDLDADQAVFTSAGTGGILASTVRFATYSPTTPVSEITNTLLPIKLLTFTAKLVGEVVEVFWTTTMEENNSYFVVERSADGVNFEEVAKLKGAGNSVNSLDYKIIDNNPLQGISYYRLVSIDSDGNKEYSKMVAISRDTKLSQEMLLFPNPSSAGKVAMRLTGFESQQATILITDALGRNSITSKMEISGGSSLISLESITKNLPVGIYFIKLTTKEGNFSSKLMIE